MPNYLFTAGTARDRRVRVSGPRRRQAGRHPLWQLLGERASTTARLAQQEADRTEAIARNAGGVAGAASTTTTGARETDRHASELETPATQMQELIAAFQV